MTPTSRYESLWIFKLWNPALRSIDEKQVDYPTSLKHYNRSGAGYGSTSVRWFMALKSVQSLNVYPDCPGRSSLPRTKTTRCRNAPSGATPTTPFRSNDCIYSFTNALSTGLNLTGAYRIGGPSRTYNLNSCPMTQPMSSCSAAKDRSIPTICAKYSRGSSQAQSPKRIPANTA